MTYEELRSAMLGFRRKHLMYLREIGSDKATRDTFRHDIRDILASLEKAHSIAAKNPAPQEKSTVKVGDLIGSMIHHYIRCTTLPEDTLAQKSVLGPINSKENITEHSHNINPGSEKSCRLKRSYSSGDLGNHSGSILPRSNKLVRTKSLQDISCAKRPQSIKLTPHTLRRSPSFYNLGLRIPPTVAFNPSIPAPSQQSLTFLSRITPYVVAALDAPKPNIIPLQPRR